MKKSQIDEMQAKAESLDAIYRCKNNLHALIERHVKEGGVPWQMIMEMLHTEHLHARVHVINEWFGTGQGG